jgi:hypothetical protein
VRYILIKEGSSDTSNREIDAIIIETIKKEAPMTNQHLVLLVKQKTSLSNSLIIERLIQLESEEKIAFKGSSAKIVTFKWWFLTILFAFLNLIILFVAPPFPYPLDYFISTFKIVFLYFLPGYTLTQCFFYSKLPFFLNDGGFSNIVIRLVLSVGLSVVISPMIGLILNYISFGVTSMDVTLSLFVIIIIFSIIGFVQEYSNRTQNFHSKDVQIL